MQNYSAPLFVLHYIAEQEISVELEYTVHCR